MRHLLLSVLATLALVTTFVSAEPRKELVVEEAEYTLRLSKKSCTNKEVLAILKMYGVSEQTIKGLAEGKVILKGGIGIQYKMLYGKDTFAFCYRLNKDDPNFIDLMDELGQQATVSIVVKPKGTGV